MQFPMTHGFPYSTGKLCLSLTHSALFAAAVSSPCAVWAHSCWCCVPLSLLLGFTQKAENYLAWVDRSMPSSLKTRNYYSHLSHDKQSEFVPLTPVSCFYSLFQIHVLLLDSNSYSMPTCLALGAHSFTHLCNTYWNSLLYQILH